ncbi:MAG: 50S ribosomal protein L11 methyltransferase [Flavobacteriales bacterium]
MNYYELTVQLSDFDRWNDILIAYLAEVDFESFQEENPFVKAYIQELLYDGEKLQSLMDELQSEEATIVTFELKLIPQQNWNAQWESQFEPVFIEDQIRVVAPFHQLDAFSGIEIVIEPKMSFGTGHHQTTHLMCASMMEMDFQRKRVLDMGSGTGVLAILAEKRGATDIVAIDIEEWSAENCTENASRNACQHIQSLHGGLEMIPSEAFDFILANINKNVLTAQIPTYVDRMKSGAYLFLSGFFVSDTDELKKLASELSLQFISQRDREGWAVLQFKK